MTSHAALLGFHQPGNSWLHRLPVGWKYLLVLALSIPPIAIATWWVTLAAVAVVLAVTATAGLRPGRMLQLGWAMWFLLGALVVFHLVTLQPLAAVTRPGNILVAVLAARILTLTTPTPVLVDALASALRPLRVLRVDPAQVALAVALMIRSIPFLLGSVTDARDAARARGLGRNPARLLTPVMLATVGYAERTGEALQARGIGDR